MSILTTETHSVWTSPAGAAIDHVLTEDLAAAMIQSARVTFELNGLVGNIQAEPYLQVSWDRVTWSAAGDGLSGVVADGTSTIVITSWFSLGSAAAQPWIRFGARVQNVASTDSVQSMGLATIRIETSSHAYP